VREGGDIKREALALVAVGDELLDGRVRDTNSSWLIERAMRRGWRVERVEVVPDDVDTIASSLFRMAGVVGAIVVTGGLGPTPDDLTRDALAKVSGEALELDPIALSHIEALFASRGRVMSPSNRRQAERCPSSTLIDNPVGTAPGLRHVVDGTEIVLLPGVPAELKAMWRNSVEARLAAVLVTQSMRTHRLRTTQVAESTLADRVSAALVGCAPVELAYCVAAHGVDVLFRHHDEAQLETVSARVREALGDRVFSEGEEELAEVAVRVLASRNQTVAVAESCTGGMVGAALTDVPGSSRIFAGGVVAYDNAVKEEHLGVPSDLLLEQGAVSEDVARSMAEGVRERFSTDWGLATTGIAGPDGGTHEKPVGTVWVALAGAGGTTVRHLRFGGERALVRRWTVAACLDGLRVGSLTLH
jgi:nicotinamide-nucleotide amidase